ncbi:MAG: putative lipid II flippase FtsW [Aquiluna sp.]|nr:putative lipid II flippase FtsW [Aquiluna sp.]MCF8544960.1 putative lipid II flippase FtsW [Aquiluna sp.]
MTDLKRPSIRPRFRAQSREFYLLISLVAFTVFLGLAMVASASSVDAFKATSNAGSTFYKQGLFALAGTFLLIVASNMPIAFYRRIGSIAMMGMIGLQLATVLFGKEVNGNKNWIDLGLFTLQPSEFLKLALIIGISYLLSLYSEDDLQNRQLTTRIAAYSGISLFLVVFMGKDMGTGVVMAVMLMGLFLFAGMRLSQWLAISAAGLAAVVLLVQMSASRRIRFDAWLNPDSADPMGVRWQYEHGTWALASGGLFGTGLGRSKLKWSWIPEVENDFIFAIIGEELGLIGAIFVILLFFLIGLTLFSIAKKQTSAFSRNMVVGVMLWIVMQALINISVVLGYLPVLGVPLPLISAGGSSLIATLGAVGVVLAVERDRMAKLGQR